MTTTSFFKNILVCCTLLSSAFAHAGQGWHLFVSNKSQNTAQVSLGPNNCWYAKDLYEVYLEPGEAKNIYFEEKNSGICNDFFDKKKSATIDVNVFLDAYTTSNSQVRIDRNGSYYQNFSQCEKHEDAKPDFFNHSSWVYKFYENQKDSGTCFYPVSEEGRNSFYLGVMEDSSIKVSSQPLF